MMFLMKEDRACTREHKNTPIDVHLISKDIELNQPQSNAMTFIQSFTMIIYCSIRL
jgi:hypothetical protein